MGRLAWPDMAELRFHFKKIIGTICLLLFSIAIAEAQSKADPCSRIVSVAPSVTETIFAAGLGASVVGVTRFCNYPEEVKQLPKIGGFLDPSLEAIFALQPSAVFLLKEQEDLAQQLTRLGLKTLSFEHRSIDGIIKSLDQISDFCGERETVLKLEGSLKEELSKYQEKNLIKTKLKVLFVVGRHTEGGKLKSLFISGKDGYYDQILNVLSAENANPAGTVAIPIATPEGVMLMNPDAIIEIIDQEEYQDQSLQDLAKAWNSLPLLKAVKHQNILILKDDFASIPGPRFPLLLSKVEDFLNVVRSKDSNS